MKKFDVLVKDCVNDKYYSTRVQAESNRDAGKYALDHLTILDKLEYENLNIVDVKRVRQKVNEL